MHAGISMNEDPLRSENLGAVASDGVAAIEMGIFRGVELHLPVVIEPHCNAVIGRDGLDDSKITVGDARRLVGSSELDAVGSRKLMGCFAVDTDGGEPAWIVCSENA
jgi:hypothetical protein